MTDEMRQARINQNLMKIEGTGWDVGYGMSEENWETYVNVPDRLLFCSNPFLVQQGGKMDHRPHHACGCRRKSFGMGSEGHPVLTLLEIDNRRESG